MPRFNDNRLRADPAQRCFTHPISISTAMSLAADAERSGDAEAAARWFALVEELEAVEVEKRRRAAEAAQAERLKSLRRWGG